MKLTDLPADLLRTVLLDVMRDVQYDMDNCDGYEDEEKERRKYLASFMDLAKVSRIFAEAVLHRSVWADEEWYLRATDFPLPSALGMRWNALLNSFASDRATADDESTTLQFGFVPLRVTSDHASAREASQLAALSICLGRTHFELTMEQDLESYEISGSYERLSRAEKVTARRTWMQDIQKLQYKSWRTVGAVLSNGCESLSVSHVETTNKRTPVVGLFNLAHWTWPKLRELDFDFVVGDVQRTRDAFHRLEPLFSGGVVDEASVPFPALRRLKFTNHEKLIRARHLLKLAAGMEECRIRTDDRCLSFWSFKMSDIISNRQFLVERFTQKMFLEKEKDLRAYQVPGYTIIYALPGPNCGKALVNNMKRHAGSLTELLPGLSALRKYGVLVSETRSGKLGMRHIAYEELCQVENLHALSIPEITSL